MVESENTLGCLCRQAEALRPSRCSLRERYRFKCSQSKEKILQRWPDSGPSTPLHKSFTLSAPASESYPGMQPFTAFSASIGKSGSRVKKNAAFGLELGYIVSVNRNVHGVLGLSATTGTVAISWHMSMLPALAFHFGGPFC